MCAKRYRSQTEWFQLITECRASGLSDAAWCRLNNISCRTFYNACRRLRNTEIMLPSRDKAGTFNLTATAKQEVVRLEILPDDRITNNCTEITKKSDDYILRAPFATPNLDNHHTIEIELNGAHIRVTNDVNPALLSKAIHSLRSMTC